MATSAPESCITAQHPPAASILEIRLISAQDLNPVYKSMQTYAVAWIDPTRKQATRTDHIGNKNPTWDEKLSFLLDGKEAAPILTVEIYTTSWIRDVLVGTAKAPVSDLLGPGSTRFVALQLLRSSGILNIGVALADSVPVSMQEPKTQVVSSPYKDELKEKINLWRSMSSISISHMANEESPAKVGSVCNASEICSDIGPSASIVAMEMAKKEAVENMYYRRRGDEGQSETGSSIIEEMTIEDARAKGYGRRDFYEDESDDESELLWDGKGRRRRHSRTRSDGSLLSCLVCGVEFAIVCGKNGRGNKGRRTRMSTVVTNSDSNFG